MGTTTEMSMADSGLTWDGAHSTTRPPRVVAVASGAHEIPGSDGRPRPSEGRKGQAENGREDGRASPRSRSSRSEARLPSGAVRVRIFLSERGPRAVRARRADPRADHGSDSE